MPMLPRRSVLLLALGAWFVGQIPAAGGEIHQLGDPTNAPARGAEQSLPSFVPGEVVVQFDRRVTRRALASLPDSHVARVGARIDLYDAAVLELTEGTRVRDAVATLSGHPAVDSVVPNYFGYFSEVPDDPRFREQWGMHNTGQVHQSSVVGRSPRGTPDADIDAPRAWDTQEGSPTTVVAIVDTGVDIRHPDLDGSIWTNIAEIPRDDIDNDGNGFVDDVHGWDVSENDNTLVERNPRVIPYQHGTHLAGIVAAEKGNGRGVAGVCPGCRIMPVKIAKPVGDEFPRFMSFRLSDELEGLAYAQEMGADIVNASFGRSRWLEVERDAFVRLGRAGILSVIAAGNSGTNHDVISRHAVSSTRRLRRPSGPSYPAAYDLDTTVTVAASTHRDTYGFFSDSGHDTIDLAAPGVDVFSTIPGDGYDLFSGTSMAAPHVAGAAALVESGRPTLSPEALRRVLLRSVDTPPKLSLASGRNPGIVTRTAGRVNAADALTAPASRGFGPTDGNIRGAQRIRRRAVGGVHGLVDYNDVFKRRLRHGARMVVSLRSEDDPFDLYVWKEGTKEIWQLEEACFTQERGCALLDWIVGSDQTKKIRFKVGRSGTYFFHVGARNRERGRYTLRVHRR